VINLLTWTCFVTSLRTDSTIGRSYTNVSAGYTAAIHDAIESSNGPGCLALTGGHVHIPLRAFLPPSILPPSILSSSSKHLEDAISNPC
jgi:hypothetical protein